jgi:outer membrane protein assembly factor BamB
VYFGDSAGRLRAIEIGADGGRGSTRILWTSPPVGMAIESAPARLGDLLIVGAWDGNVHAFDATSGEPRWSRPGPRSSEGGAARYYAPADCAPVVVRDRVYVCDRGYQVAWYAPDGTMTRLPHANVAGIGLSADGEHLFLRGTDDVLRRVDRDGALVWSTGLPLGRAPVPPIEHDGVVHVVSDQGLWSQVDGRTGRVLKSTPVSATAYVLEPPELLDDGTVVVHAQSGARYAAPPAAASR